MVDKMVLSWEYFVAVLTAVEKAGKKVNCWGYCWAVWLVCMKVVLTVDHSDVKLVVRWAWEPSTHERYEILHH